MITLETAEAMADRLGVSPRTIRDWARTGKIPCVRITAKVVRFDVADVLQSLRAGEPQTGKKPNESK